MRTYIFNVSAILSADNIKVQMSFFLILFFLPSLNWKTERESIQWQWRGEGENSFTVYLAFRRWVSSESIFFNGLVEFYGARLEASAISCPRALFRFFTRSFGHSVRTSCHTNCCPKTDFFLFLLTKRVLLPFLGFWPIIRPLSYSFTLSGDPFGLLSLPPRWGYGVQIAWPTFFSSFNRPAEVDLHSLFLLLTVSLWGPVNSNTEG